MNVRIARKDDLEQIKNIWKYCFNDPDGFFNYYFQNKYKEENTLVVENEEEIISSLQMNQYKIVLNNKVYDTSYIVGVSTLAQARGKGSMRILMSEALRELYRRNQLISILMPIDYRLYRPYGYEHCYDQLEYLIQIETLGNFKISGEFKKAKIEDVDALIDIYNFSMKDKNGFTVRDKYYFENLFKEIECENGHIYLHKSEEFDGYMIYFLLEDKIFVREIFYKNIQTLKSFLKFIYNHNTQFKNVSITTPIDDKIKCIISNLKDIEIKIKPFMMGRIINFEEFIKTLDLDKINCNLKLKIEDNFIDENNKTFNIDICNGKVQINKTDKEYDIKIDINTLSQLAFSYSTTKEAVFLGKICYKDTKYLDMLEDIFNIKVNYINEYV
ncbi:GNAT family N-acetyltransferase [Alkalithermobacter paradoxus]|uniref:N-acetyltransferase domain-containing protein n=1 Tax=Alkalithermobacter paradoxus TaxID=29349 RepID=A0A1V4I6S8_9FIRM|nr:hypothetical protein CLOTH_13480 [[Clostridium] thermoalcaliphilum]